MPIGTLNNEKWRDSGKVAEYDPADYGISKFAEGNIPFGVACAQGSEGKDVKLPDIDSKIVGVSGYNVNASNLKEVKYEDKDPVALILRGTYFVRGSEEVKEGDQVNVSFLLKGREWTAPDGEVKYFNTLEAWRVEAYQSSTWPKQPDMPQPENFDNSTDDLPF